MASSSNNAGGGGGKKSKGRQKIEIKKMENESNLHVTFSKRRTGLYKKASEISTLCGVEVALIIFSPGNKVSSFGHPNIEAVLERFLNDGVAPPQPALAEQILDLHRNAAVQDLNDELAAAMAELEMERKRGKELDKKLKTMEKAPFLGKPVNSLKRDELREYKDALENMKKAVYEQANHAVKGFVSNPSQFRFGPRGSSESPLIMLPPPPPPPPQQLVMQNVAAPVVPMQPPAMEDAMMMFDEQDMMLMMASPEPLMTPAQPPLPAAMEVAAAAPEGFPEFEENMMMGDISGGGYY